MSLPPTSSPHVGCHVGQCWGRPGRGGGGRNEVWGGPRARWGDAVPTFPSPPWDSAFIYLEKGINTQANAKLQVHFLGWAPQPFPWLSSGLSWHVLLSCRDFQLLHSEVTSKKLLVLYPPFFFSPIALYYRQSFWHVHLISLWQEDGSMDELWINSKSSKLEIGIALLSTVLVSWLPLGQRKVRE